MTAAPAIRALSLAGLRTPPAVARGPLPRLAWIDIEALLVDMDYQRDVLRRGRSNIQAIADAFDWAFFAPVIVAPIGAGDFFVIVDGQHRATAAKLAGAKKVPCCIVTADRQKQARAFAAINGSVTRMQPVQLHRAAVLAGDAAALRIESLAKAGGARILRSPTPVTRMRPGDTQALETLARCDARFGGDCVTEALTALTDGGDKYIGLINEAVLTGLCMALAPRRKRKIAWATDRAALRGVDLVGCLAAARKARAERSGALQVFVCEAIVVELNAIARDGMLR